MDEATIYTLVFLAWLTGAATFVIGLHLMNSPATARSGNRISAAGMTLATFYPWSQTAFFQAYLSDLPWERINKADLLRQAAGIFDPVNTVAVPAD